ncbi:CASP8-associated protein 2 [Tiliqua scincoides]|uniref:CASP8-associated protein 2 n=1 Tax=Tiliqua scincoides TaxID=71010 RepID=UPI003463194F
MAMDDNDGMTYSNLLHGDSPCGGRDDDESSVDIYDGLDSTSILSVNTATKVTPARSNLNLFDEILIEEGTAKEASYNDLQAENERHQQQLQELMKKLQEIQEQNSTLQKENQSLKKNISALIKTARVEINRKDEEISKLQRRFSEVPVHQNVYTRTYFQASANSGRNSEGSKAKTNAFRDSLTENNPKMGHRTKQAQSKDMSHSHPPGDTENKKSYSEKRNGMDIQRPHPEELHSDGVHSRLTNVDSSADKEKGKREIKSNDCRYKTKAQQNGGSTTDKMLDVHEKLHVNPEKTIRNGLWKDSKDLKIRNCPKTEKFPKQLMLKDKLVSKTEYSSSDRDEKSQNTNQKDLKRRNKDDNSGGQRLSQRHQEPQRRPGKESNLPERNINAKSPQKLSKSYMEDRKRKDSNCRRSRDESEHGFRGRKLSPLPPSMSNRDRKRGHSKENSSKHEFESVHSKSERHRTEEKRKNERESLREDWNLQNERTDSKVVSQKIAKEAIKKCNARKEGNKSFPAEELAKTVDDLEPQISTNPRKNEEQSKSKDLKLSFMQTLNLTLSPAKKQGEEFKTVSKSINNCDREILGQKNIIVPAEPITTNKQEKTSDCIPNNSVQTILEKIMISEPSVKVRSEDVAETLDPESSKTTSDLQKTEECELVDNVKVLPKPGTEVEEADETLMASSPGSPLDQGTLPDNVFNDLETVSSLDFDSFSVIDEINGTDSDSLVEMEETSNFASEKIFKTPEKENTLPKPVPFKNTVEESKLSEDVPPANQKSSLCKPSFPDGDLLKTCKVLSPTVQVQDAQPISADDDNSILSIDLNHMRYIPKVISPINSPIRPLAKALRMECLYKGSMKNYNIVPEGTVVCPTKNLSSDLNKENQKPLRTDHQISEMESQLNLSSDELEEGEIVSDEDKPTIERHSENGKRSRGKTSPDRSNLANSPHNPNAKTTPSSEDTGKLPSKKKKTKEKFKTETIISSKEVKKNNTVNINSLEKIVHITAEPSTLHEVMQMLRAIRKQLRKNYMKLKIQFPIQQFHRIIDSAILNFTSLVKYLDFSKVSKTSNALKLNLCEVIESKLKLIKKNSAVEHLFEQQQLEMKKRLWKLVDEQLDNLFDKIKKILLKLCKSIGNERDGTADDKQTAKSPKCLVSHKTDRQKSKKQTLNARTQKLEECALPKPVVGNQLSRKGHSDINKMDTAKNMTTKQTSSYSVNTKHSQAGVELSKGKSIQDMESALKAGKYEKEGLQVVGDSQKSDLSCGPLTEQQMSGLTFNLVNDAQMGEMFKSLLQGSDLSEKNVDYMDENQWEFKTPIKHMPVSQTCGDDPAYEAEESIPKETRTESRVLDDIKWPVVSPEREPSFLARLQMPIDPDILDESCMFDIPTSPALKKGEGCISGRPKSLVSSVLLEDLAVSLTIPSPLKSDSHLSFLKPDVFGSVPENVLSAHFSEDAHLEEEDASEQDIHLALESDNSSSKSSCSSSWASMPAAPGFQYCPSLPMQAVIMEKSNDHFIVKIRRAAPSTSPGLDQVSVANEPLTSFTERGDSEILSQENLDILNSKSIPLEKAAVSKEKRKITDSESQMSDNIVNQQASDLLESVKEPLACLEKDETKQSEPQQDANSDAPDKVLESVECLFSNSKQEQQLSNMSVPLQEPSRNTSQNQGPGLLATHQTLHSGKHSVADSEDTSDLLDTPKELEKPLESLKRSPNKTSQNENIPEVFELPQIDTMRSCKVASCAIVEHSPISSAVVPLEDEFSSKAHFSICIDLTDEPPMENEVDSWDLTVEPALSEGTRSLNKANEECKTADHCVTDDPLEHRVNNAIINLTEPLPDKLAAGENFETKINLNIDGPGGQPSLDKESKKRKKETEEISCTKRQRKESCETACKKSVRSSKKSKETVNILSKTTPSVRDKDALPPTSSLSPSSLYAKNIIKKKGEVIVSWTRNDDREILLECQKKGPSEKTFASLGARLNKSSNQVEERFKQLVKLFQMSHCS